ncbi:unnamed protein product [Hydatigera taeniaeformis]|uniref:Origin recognition complex subunit 2 n=1 Tax=Hydatigena taeniaeformis TaxID=6205 RepID=A0A0R3WML1_HYDTA|nr:unnamed protein product [Hydatigera taeniaeformis]
MKRPAKTSKQTLAKLRADRENGLFDLKELESLLADYNSPHIDILEQRLQKLGDALLPNFRVYLMEGFNIILYGVGSKLRLLSRLRSEYLNGDNCLVVSGYSSTIGIRKVCICVIFVIFSPQILNVIIDEVMQIEDAPAGIDKRLDLIIDHFSRPTAADAPLFLLINCIDGRNLRTARVQAILARLAAVPHIHIVATMDNINLPILWSQTEVSRFSWIWEECSTLLPYSIEAGFASSHLLQELFGSTGNVGSQLTDRHVFLNPDVDVVALTRLRHVMASLTKNGCDIFRLLVEYQIQAVEEAQADLHEKNATKIIGPKASLKKSRRNEEGEAAPKGMPLEELYWRCRDAFLTNTEVNLRAQLTEFKDHKLIKFLKDSDGTELLCIPLDLASLREIIENKEMFP